MCNRSSCITWLLWFSANTAVTTSMWCLICWVTWPAIQSRRLTPLINSGLKARPPSRLSSTPFQTQYSSSVASATTETKMCPIKREISQSPSTSSNGSRNAQLKTTRESSYLTPLDAPPTRTSSETLKTTEKLHN